MIYLLLGIIVIIFLFVIYIDKDIFSPSAIICESYMLAVICAIFNIESWNIHLLPKTVIFIVMGILSFVFTSILILHTHIRKKDVLVKNENRKFKIDKGWYTLLVFVQILTAVLYLYYVVKTVGGAGRFLHFANLMNFYRENTAYGELQNMVPTVVNQLVKVSKIIAYITMYDVLVRKIEAKKNNTSYHITVLNIISILSFILLSLFSGGRYGMISFVLR